MWVSGNGSTQIGSSFVNLGSPLNLGLSVARSSNSFCLMWHNWILAWIVSLYRNFGQPWCLLPTWSSTCIKSLGILHSSIRMRFPTHRSWALMSMGSMLVEWARSRTSRLEMWSCHLISSRERQMDDSQGQCIPRVLSKDGAPIYSFTRVRRMLYERDSGTTEWAFWWCCTRVVIYVVYSGSCEHFATHFSRADKLISVKGFADIASYLCWELEHSIIGDAQVKGRQSVDQFLLACMSIHHHPEICWNWGLLFNLVSDTSRCSVTCLLAFFLRCWTSVTGLR